MTLYTVLVIHLASRRVRILGTMPHPEEAFMRQIVRTLTMADAELCRVLIEHPTLDLSPRFCQLLAQLREEWRLLDQAIHDTDRELAGRAQDDEACRRLTQVPGIGPLTATAFVAAGGRGAAFAKGRDFAAWLGLVPRQHSTGGKTALRGISQRGNPYLRYLFIHGARAVCRHHRRRPHRWGHWIANLEARAHPNIVVVALANKLARTASAVLQRDGGYDGRLFASA